MLKSWVVAEGRESESGPERRNQRDREGREAEGVGREWGARLRAAPRGRRAVQYRRQTARRRRRGRWGVEENEEGIYEGGGKAKREEPSKRRRWDLPNRAIWVEPPKQVSCGQI